MMPINNGEGPQELTSESAYLALLYSSPIFAHICMVGRLAQRHRGSDLLWINNPSRYSPLGLERSMVVLDGHILGLLPQLPIVLFVPWAIGA